MRNANPLLPAFFSLICIPSSPAQADTNIYKYRSSEGDISYSQERSGSGELEAVIRVPSTPKSVSQRSARQELKEDKEKAEILANERRKKEAWDKRIEQAEQELAFAEMTLANHLEPTPDERQTTVSGNSRLTDAYWMRIRAMQLSIEMARDRLQHVSEEVALQSALHATGTAPEPAAIHAPGAARGKRLSGY